MKREDSTHEWLETVPSQFDRLMGRLEDLAITALQDGHPYHSVRLDPANITAAGNHGGRLLGWCIAVTTKEGWEYESTTIAPDGVMWLLFKNPYVFS
jgi:hypothetical protein